jgi:hypothetical protein
MKPLTFIRYTAVAFFAAIALIWFGGLGKADPEAHIMYPLFSQECDAKPTSMGVLFCRWDAYQNAQQVAANDRRKTEQKQ